MMITLLATATLLATLVLVFSNLRTIASDTVDAVTSCAVHAHQEGRLWSRLAFIALWVMIFWLSFL